MAKRSLLSRCPSYILVVESNEANYTAFITRLIVRRTSDKRIYSLTRVSVFLIHI